MPIATPLLQPRRQHVGGDDVAGHGPERDSHQQEACGVDGLADAAANVPRCDDLCLWLLAFQRFMIGCTGATLSSSRRRVRSMMSLIRQRLPAVAGILYSSAGFVLLIRQL